MLSWDKRSGERVRVYSRTTIYQAAESMLNPRKSKTNEFNNYIRMKWGWKLLARGGSEANTPPLAVRPSSASAAVVVVGGHVFTSTSTHAQRNACLNIHQFISQPPIPDIHVFSQNLQYNKKKNEEKSAFITRHAQPRLFLFKTFSQFLRRVESWLAPPAKTFFLFLKKKTLAMSKEVKRVNMNGSQDPYYRLCMCVCVYVYVCECVVCAWLTFTWA